MSDMLVGKAIIVHGGATQNALDAERWRDLAKQLAEALLDHGTHKLICEHNDSESPMCTCGLNKALTAARKAGLLGKDKC